jgi:glutamate synthase (NADPH/NADH) large chain
MTGRVDRLDMKQAISHWKAHGIDLTRLLHQVPLGEGPSLNQSGTQDHGLEAALDNDLIASSADALASRQPVRIERKVINVNRTVGAMLSGRVAEKYGHAGLPDNTINVKLTGVAGQSFGAWLAHGVTLDLTGDANDYVGKGLSGGRVIVRQPSHVERDPTENIIVGNTVLYGAIAGEAFFNGVGGERFAVRNSGAHAVVEGVGDHGCEYMTGGKVVILGRTGRNFAAGMSGGVAYVYDPDGELPENLNAEMVELESLDEDDAEYLYGTIQAHVDATDSAVGQRILADWSAQQRHFAKVMPRDYKKVLQAIAEAERDGVDIDKAIMAAAHG